MRGDEAERGRRTAELERDVEDVGPRRVGLIEVAFSREKFVYSKHLHDTPPSHASASTAPHMVA